MSFTERLKVVIDVVSDGATRGLSDFRSEVAKADTFTGKLKAGTKSLSGAFSSFVSSPVGAATAVTAVTAAVIGAADKFADLAKQSIDLGKAIGMSTEQASRWIAVGDDFGVSAEALATGVGRISKSLDSDKWAKYGIATRDAAGQARDSNAIFLDALDVIGRTPSAAERARVGADLLGKGWQSISPMIGKTRDEYEQLLSSVSDGQVVTAGEAERAERWRLAQDNLSDAFGDVALSAGNVAVSLAPVLDGLADLITMVPKILELAGVADTSGEAFADFSTELDGSSKSSSDMIRAFQDLAVEAFKTGGTIEGTKRILDTAFNNRSTADTALILLTDTLRNLAASAPEDAQAVVDSFGTILAAAARGDKGSQEYLTTLGFTLDTYREWKGIVGDSIATSDAAAGAESGVAAATRETTDALQRKNRETQKQIDLERELYGDQRDAIERQRDYAQTQVDMMTTMADGNATINEQMDAVIGLSEEYGTLKGASLDSREGTFRQIEKLKELQATMVPGSPLYEAVAGYIAQLELIPPTVDTQVRLGIIGSVFNSVGDMVGQRFGARALGGPVSKDEMYQVGEGGKPELLTDSAGRTFLIPGRDGVVTPIGGTMPSGGAPAGNVTINVTVTNPMMSGEQLANELRAYITRNGKAWLS